MIGKTVSHYKILAELGAGGMGVVYKAEDLKLRRTVALKFLPPELTRGKKDKQRFVHEAQAASAIDHSNICTIFEIDETEDGQLFICMAYYDGKNLKERIEEGALELKEAIDIAIHIAQGLVKAHAQEIVHRDVKPANIFITDEGEVKIVDFGLAKLTGQARLTSTGKTMGTVAYMSPEQGQGGEVGPGTDIWALGVVLYEMVTGQLPFKQDHELAVMYSIMNEEPEPMSNHRAGIPVELEHIVSKAMAKKPEDRYQHATELLDDLNRLKYHFGVDDSLATQPWKFDARSKKILPIIALIVAIAAVAFTVVQQLKHREEQSPLLPGKPIQVTSGNAWESEPALSPDGGRIAYTSDISGNRDIYIIDSHGGNPLKLTTDPASDYSPTWFPDGSSLAFSSERGGETCIWKIGQLGGGATLMIRNAEYPAISPNGKTIAFSTPFQGADLRIAVAPLADLSDVTVLTKADEGVWSHRDPAWSPDGKTICYSTQHSLWTIPASGGRARRLTPEGTFDADPVWSNDSKHIYFSSDREGTLALWRVPSSGGRAKRLTMGSGRENDPTICGDGSRLAYATKMSQVDLVLRDLDTGRETKLEGLRDDHMAAMAPDKSAVVYSSTRVGPNDELWRQPLVDGIPSGSPQRLTDHTGISSHPIFSPNGKWLAYYRIIDEQRDLWIISSTGGQPIQFTEHPDIDIHPAWSPDGSMIAFISERQGGSDIWIAPIEAGKRTGPPRRIEHPKISAYAPVWSPSGKQIAFVGIKDNLMDVWIAQVDGSTAPRCLTHNVYARRIRWDLSTGDILVSATWGEDHFTLHRISSEDGSLISKEPIVVFGSRITYAFFDISRDGRFLVYSREAIRSNIWMLEAEIETF